MVLGFSEFTDFPLNNLYFSFSDFDIVEEKSVFLIFLIAALETTP